ncbi:MAG: cyclase family protein [Nitrososphaerales archaeon]
MKAINLSVTVGSDTFGPPSTNQRVELEPHYRGPGFWVSSSISMSIHTGSHIDSPSHVFKDGSHVDSIEPERLVGKPNIIRLSVGESQSITKEDLEKHKISAGDILLISTGWSDLMWGRFPDYYTKSPYLTPEAAQYLASLKIRAIGFDFFEEYSARLPEFGSEDFVVHRILLGGGVVLMEHMTNIRSLTPDAIFVAAPLRLKGVEGSPASFLGIVQ